MNVHFNVNKKPWKKKSYRNCARNRAPSGVIFQQISALDILEKEMLYCDQGWNGYKGKLHIKSASLLFLFSSTPNFQMVTYRDNGWYKNIKIYQPWNLQIQQTVTM